VETADLTCEGCPRLILNINLQHSLGYVVLNAFSVQETENKLLKAADTGKNSFQNGREKQEEAGKKKTRVGGGKRKIRPKHSARFILEKTKVSQQNLSSQILAQARRQHSTNL
jgi:hypothetical protein